MPARLLTLLLLGIVLAAPLSVACAQEPSGRANDLQLSPKPAE